MKIQAYREFSAWFDHVKRAGGPLLTRAASLLAVLRDLGGKPGDDSASLKRIRQARRHEIWRVAHPFDPQFAVRILCWFPDHETAVVALLGGDKAGISEVWYDSATVRAEAAVDQWKREHEIEEQP